MTVEQARAVREWGEHVLRLYAGTNMRAVGHVPVGMTPEDIARNTDGLRARLDAILASEPAPECSTTRSIPGGHIRVTRKAGQINVEYSADKQTWLLVHVEQIA